MTPSIAALVLRHAASRTQRPRRLLIAASVAAVLGVAAATVALAWITPQLRDTSGLRGTYVAGSEQIERLDAVFSRELLDGAAGRLGGQRFSARWQGYVVVPATDIYRFALLSDDDKARIDVGGRTVADARMQLGAPVPLTRGLHQITVEYTDDGRLRRYLFLQWARGDEPVQDISPLLLVPELRDHREVRRRRVLAAASPLLPFAMLPIVLVPVGWLVLRATRWIRETAAVGGPARWVFGGCALLFLAGAWWGVPSYGSWAPDEVTPSDVLTALDYRFAGGWATIYPPLHYILLSLLFLPHALAAALGLVDLTTLASVAHLTVLGRLLSVAMALGIVLVVHAIAREHFGPRAGLFAALVMSVALPLTYYAKTTNLDVPYVFWLALSLLFYARVNTRGRPGDFYLFALTGVAAVCTKDQAYGFYVLPAAYMSAAALVYAASASRPSGVPTLRVLVRMALVTVGAFAAFWNLPLNASGLLEHVRLITGVASEGFRMFPNTVSGHLRLLSSSLQETATAMSWPLAAAAVWAIGLAAARRQRVILQLFLPAVSYYVCFISVVMYQYDRFFLGMIVIASLAAGWWLQTWTAEGVAGRRWRLALVAIALAYAASRAVALDLLMIWDARYATERALRARAAAEEQVAAPGMAIYLPRPEMRRWRAIAEDPEELAGMRPDYVVVNAGYALRSRPGTRQAAFYEALSSGQAGYTRLERFDTRWRYSPLALERRFRELREDEFSNLPKVSPVVEIYVRSDVR